MLVAGLDPAPPHQGMNSGYFSTSATRSNIWAAL